ncbi:MAG: BRCT domain-containing protein [Deltaproteobacteria bacterium]|nr:BRCT domain-containing protein [Deltaproteobacteria bacterium]
MTVGTMLDQLAQHGGAVASPGQRNTETLPEMLQRALDELTGLCKGIISDGRVTPQETLYLQSWLDTHLEISQVWPANVLRKRISEILEDNRVDMGEQQDLLAMLQRMTGERPDLSLADKLATHIPYTLPEPKIDFKNRKFCLTGKFVYGTRVTCEEAIQKMGGSCVASPDENTHFIVVGSLEIPQWAKMNKNQKLEKGVSLVEDGYTLAIVSEEHWTAELLSWS